MGIVYHRSGEETAKKCSCGTVWKDSWVDRDADKNRCPACHKLFEEQGNVKLNKIVMKKQDLLIRKIIALDSRLKEIELKLIDLNAGVPVMNETADSIQISIGEIVDKYKENRKQSYSLESQRINVKNEVIKLKEQLEISTIKEPLARTEVQNYEDFLTSRTTVRPQYNWTNIEKIFPRERWSVKC